MFNLLQRTTPNNGGSMRFDSHFFISVIPEAVLYGTDIPELISCVVDSRLTKPGDIFIALQGTHVDGHDFISDAVERGAAGLIVASHKEHLLKKLPPESLKKLFIAVVPEVQDAILKLAHAWRKVFTYPVIGITGSIGKTFTKELLKRIFDVEGRQCIASLGTQNTLLGSALTILRMRSDHKVAIFEMGISKQGEMAQLAALVQPTNAIITAIGHSHMEGLGSLSHIASEKRDIFKYFGEGNIGIINGDQSVLSTIAYAHPIIRFGCKTVNQIQARKIINKDNQVSFTLKLYKERFSVTLTSNHRGCIMNTLAAVAMSNLLGVDSKTIVHAIKMPLTVPGRFEQKSLKNCNGILYNDCYNASPESMKEALMAFEKITTKTHKIAVLGDMLELGVNSPFWHRQLGRLLRKVPSLQHVVLVGEQVQWTYKTIPVGITVDRVNTWQEAIPCLEQKIHNESAILVKGSRSIGLNHLVANFTIDA
jgi:UDP-N-acetylmuramoyl-tripeptide--D-alanyl-D-alanine ligase